jgi:hypothetical protein
MIVIAAPWQGREECAMIYTMCKEEKPTNEQVNLARAIYEAMKKASPNSLMDYAEDDTYLSDDLTVDGRFNFMTVARNIIASRLKD